MYGLVGGTNFLESVDRNSIPSDFRNVRYEKGTTSEKIKKTGYPEHLLLVARLFLVSSPMNSSHFKLDFCLINIIDSMPSC